MGKIIYKTYQNRPNLEKIFIEGCDNFKPGLILKDLNNIIVENSIIYETVYDDDLFQNLYNDIDKIYELSPHQLAEYFPIKSNFYKKLKIINNSFKHLYFYKCNFKTSNFYQILKTLSAEKINDKMLNEKAEEIKNKVSENAEGAFVWFKENNYFGILFINTLKNLGIKTPKHEFIHYFEWAKGNISDDYVGDEEFYKEDIKLIQKYINSNFNEDKFKYSTTDKEFETFLIEFLDFLLKISLGS